ncbi:uncharacterized protein A1O9_01412 [Exophiala aquamarina CBS 119918]|uniref:Calmodulin n=1 Tax=Exophiala aquamarina CBS 119918 TaxID=1182545 RepID=A0A072PTK6_9EURO|nr:uncharacterized protein A1O9_01412 [Exophiala aquamarina CBS 119918]KEF63434.1 hypothetical protein A1O9_01412 [Exophiala aquamarina CBS 119918]
MKRAWGRLFSEDDLTHALKDVTTDKNGNIDFQRFLAAITAEGTSSLEIDFANDEEMAKVFRIADKDGDGFLSAKEVRNFLGGGSEIDGEIDLMIEEADLDSDGRIDCEHRSYCPLAIVRSNVCPM